MQKILDTLYLYKEKYLLSFIQSSCQGPIIIQIIPRVARQEDLCRLLRRHRKANRFRYYTSAISLY